jgi:hypothetical protein
LIQQILEVRLAAEGREIRLLEFVGPIPAGADPVAEGTDGLDRRQTERDPMDGPNGDEKSVDGSPAQREPMRTQPKERCAVRIGSNQSLLKCISWQPAGKSTHRHWFST